MFQMSLFTNSTFSVRRPNVIHRNSTADKSCDICNNVRSLIQGLVTKSEINLLSSYEANVLHCEQYY